MLPLHTSLSACNRSTALTPKIRDSPRMSRRSTVSRLSRRSETRYRFTSEATSKGSTSELILRCFLGINSYLKGQFIPRLKRVGFIGPLNPEVVKKRRAHRPTMIGVASFFFFCLSFLVIAFLLLPWARFFSAISSPARLLVVFSQA